MARTSRWKLKPLKKPKPSFVYDSKGNAMHEYKAVLYGNNAAWICPKCECVIIARTYMHEKPVDCCNDEIECPAKFRLISDKNRKGAYLYGPAKKVIYLLPGVSGS